MKLMKNKKYLQQKISRKGPVPQTTADFTSRVSKSYVPFTCKFPMIMHFVPILHRRCRSKTNFYVFSYDKISLKILCKFQIFPCSIRGEIPKNLLSEQCEKRNNNNSDIITAPLPDPISNNHLQHYIPTVILTVRRAALWSVDTRSTSTTPYRGEEEEEPKFS